MERLVASVRAARPLAWLAALLLFAFLLLNTADVVARTLDVTRVRGVIEYTEVGLVLVVFLALAPAFASRMHISVDLVTARLPPRVAAGVEAAGLAVCSGLVAWWTYAATLVAIDSTRRGEYRFGLVEVPVWPARIVVPIGVGCLLAYLLVRVVRLTRFSVVGSGRHPDAEGG